MRFFAEDMEFENTKYEEESTKIIIKEKENNMEKELQKEQEKQKF